MNIEKKYKIEIEKITEIIDQLKNEYVFEITKVQAHGKIVKHAKDLELYFNDLIDKISNNKPSKMDEFKPNVVNALSKL